jgi:exopolysaccharide biosynthesis polyprenyl glycosylphosphotransferase
MDIMITGGLVLDHQVRLVYQQHTGLTIAPDYPKEFNRFGYSGMKRLLDILAAGFGLVFAAPTLTLASIIIKLDSPGPVVYKQERVGKDGIIFDVIKLRTMRTDAEKNGPQWAEKSDNRVTRIGKFLRMTRIDEIPQLWNVLRGDMSMVGPRPERPNFTLQFNNEVPGFVERLKVKPGVTGIAQVNGGYDLTPAEKLELDRLYIENQSIWTDIKVLAMTVWVVLSGYGAR